MTLGEIFTDLQEGSDESGRPWLEVGAYCSVYHVDAGDRGGGLQYATFGIIIAGLAVVMTVVLRNVLRSDRRKAAEVADPDLRWKK